MSIKSDGKIRMNLAMNQFQKKYFPTYCDANIWRNNTKEKHDGVIRRDTDGRYFIFVKTASQELQGL